MRSCLKTATATATATSASAAAPSPSRKRVRFSEDLTTPPLKKPTPCSRVNSTKLLISKSSSYNGDPMDESAVAGIDICCPCGCKFNLLSNGYDLYYKVVTGFSLELKRSNSCKGGTWEANSFGIEIVCGCENEFHIRSDGRSFYYKLRASE